MSFKVGDLVLIDRLIMAVVAVHDNGCDMVDPVTMALYTNVTDGRLLPDVMADMSAHLIDTSIELTTRSLLLLSAAMEARHNSQKEAKDE